MKIVFLNRYLFTDYSATSQLLSDVAFHCGLCPRLCSTQPGGVKGLVDAITRLAGNNELCETLGRNARKALESYYEMRHALQKWRDLLDAAAQQ